MSWRTDGEAALAEAQRAGRPCLLWFTHDGCESDHARVEAELFQDDAHGVIVIPRRDP